MLESSARNDFEQTFDAGKEKSIGDFAWEFATGAMIKLIKLDALHKQLLTTAASLNARLCELIELRQRLKKALSTPYHTRKTGMLPSPEISSATRARIKRANKASCRK